MMELVDMRDLGSRASGVGVRVPTPAPYRDSYFDRVTVPILFPKNGCFVVFSELFGEVVR